MKNLQTKFAILLLSTLCLLTAAYGQITPSQDAYTNTADPTINYGPGLLLYVNGATETSYIQFDLSSIPAGASVSQATLKLYVNAVTAAGSFNVDYVNGAWTESKITSSLAPALGTTIVSSVPITAANKNKYILINITPAVQAWLDGDQANDGIALVANSTFNASFDSKENTTTSHPAELDIVFAGIAGVTTASGGGLTGGGTGGTLNLSLTNACATNQVLQWTGTAWSCAAVGAGTITSVTAGAGLSGGGTTGSVMLAINPAIVPQLGAANTFTGNQTVTGTLSASGFNIGSNLFAFGTYASSNAFLGFAGNKTVTGVGNVGTGYQALLNDTSGFGNTAVGFLALAHNTAGNLNTAVGGDSGLTLDGSNLATGSSNTFIGYNSKISTGTLSNVVAIGANAMVAENNAIVLGQINGVNGATVGTAVGIGTTTPQALLDVSTGGLDTFIGNPHCTGANFAGIAFAANSTGGFQSCTNYSMVGDGVNTWLAAPTGNLYFRVNKNTDTAMMVNATGQVGIGTAAPGYQFEVYGAGATKAGMAMVSTGTDAALSLNDTNTAGGGREYLLDSGSGTAGVGAGNFAIWDNTAETARLVVNSTGNVGIGTKTPGAWLEVAASGTATSADTIAVYGQALSPSIEGVPLGQGVGLWGDSGDYGFTGVLGTADNGTAAKFYNNAPGNSYPALYIENDAPEGGWVFQTYGGNVEQQGDCNIDTLGNLNCSGDINESAVVDGGARKVALYSTQSTENWFEDAGSGQLLNGSARIQLDPTYAQTVNTGVEYHVFLTPNGDSKGLYVSQKSATSFEVHEQGGGTSNIAFDYRIMAKRVGHEKLRLADLTDQYKKMAAQRQAMRRPVQPSAAPQVSPAVPSVRSAAQPVLPQPRQVVGR